MRYFGGHHFPAQDGLNSVANVVYLKEIQGLTPIIAEVM